MGYKFLEHTADVKFNADGATLEDVFLESSQALKETISGDIDILAVIEKTIEKQGSDLQNLLYLFLEEFLFLLDSEDFLFSKIKSLNIDEKNFKLTAVVLGDLGAHYNFTNDVKAVTYNDMFLKKENGKWTAQVVLDV